MDTSDIILKLLEILTAWPVILLIIIFFFHKDITKVILEMGPRVKSINIGGNTIELENLAAMNAFKETVISGAHEFKDNPSEFINYVERQANKIPEVKASSPNIALPLIKRSILWVDDNPANNKYESNLLVQLGASITTALSTKEAEHILKNNSYNLIISDVSRVEDKQMNPNAGYELLESVSKDGIKTPFIFYTGNVLRADRSRIKQAYGIADTASDLINLVKSALA